MLSEIYNNSSEDVKELLREKYSNEELRLHITVTQEEFNKFFKELLYKNYNNKLLFEIIKDVSASCFYFSHDRIFPLFEKKFGINVKECCKLMADIVESEFECNAIHCSGVNAPYGSYSINRKSFI